MNARKRRKRRAEDTGEYLRRLKYYVCNLFPAAYSRSRAVEDAVTSHFLLPSNVTDNREKVMRAGKRAVREYRDPSKTYGNSLENFIARKYETSRALYAFDVPSDVSLCIRKLYHCIILNKDYLEILFDHREYSRI